jgi:hypothetical protein
MGSLIGSPNFFNPALPPKAGGRTGHPCLRLATGYKFDEAVEEEADPRVDQKAPVETVGFVLRGRREMWHEDEEVEQAAKHDGGELFEEAGHCSCQLSVASRQFLIPPYRKRVLTKCKDLRIVGCHGDLRSG